SRGNILAYARSYGDDREHYERTAPLLFAVVYSFEASLKPLFDETVSSDPMRLLRRLVRASLDIQAWAPVRPGDGVTTTAKIERIEARGSGELLEIDTLSCRPTGEPVALVKHVHFIRGEGGPAEPKDRAPATSPPPPIPIDWE